MLTWMAPQMAWAHQDRRYESIRIDLTRDQLADSRLGLRACSIEYALHGVDGAYAVAQLDQMATMIRRIEHHLVAMEDARASRQGAFVELTRATALARVAQERDAWVRSIESVLRRYETRASRRAERCRAANRSHEARLELEIKNRSRAILERVKGWAVDAEIADLANAVWS